MRKKIGEKKRRQKLPIWRNRGANPTGIQKMKRNYYERLLLINSKYSLKGKILILVQKDLDRVKNVYMNRKFT